MCGVCQSGERIIYSARLPPCIYTVQGRTSPHTVGRSFRSSMGIGSSSTSSAPAFSLAMFHSGRRSSGPRAVTHLQCLSRGGRRRFAFSRDVQMGGQQGHVGWVMVVHIGVLNVKERRDIQPGINNNMCAGAQSKNAVFDAAQPSSALVRRLTKFHHGSVRLLSPLASHGRAGQPEAARRGWSSVIRKRLPLAAGQTG